MAATWTIVNTERTIDGSKGANQIHQLHWECTDKETVDGVVHSGRSYGSISIPEPSGTFIAYGSVTHENLCDLVQGYYGIGQGKRNRG